MVFGKIKKRIEQLEEENASIKGELQGIRQLVQQLVKSIEDRESALEDEEQKSTFSKWIGSTR
ncbi:MAG: hypothetical protein SO434_04295 [Eubacteriales bacterium]|nr:hypothetical protein [Eubacteriales bacterium]